MTSKLQEHRRMLEEAQQLTGSLEHGQSFLATAFGPYKYPYYEQVMIHVQRSFLFHMSLLHLIQLEYNISLHRLHKSGSQPPKLSLPDPDGTL